LGAETGQPVLRVTKDHLYFYAPSNREAVICDHNGAVLAQRSVTDIVNEIAADGFHLVQIHQVDFNDDGEIVLELLVAHDRDSAALEVVRIKITSGESGTVHKSSVGPPMGSKTISTST
jgi:hypothetical protein